MSTDEVIEDEELYVIGSLYQNGTIAGPQDIELTATNTETGAVSALGTHEATLTPDFYHLGAANMSFSLNDPGTYDIALGGRHAGTVTVEPAVSDIQVIAASLTAIEVTEGEELHVIGSIYQNGTIEGPQTINVTATNTMTNETTTFIGQEVSLTPGFYHLGGINTSITLDEGTYEITLGGREAGTVYVDENPSDIRVIAASLSEIEVLEGEEFYVIASIYQAGDSGTEELELTAAKNGGQSEVVGSQEVTLNSGVYHLGAINISVAFDDPGSYELELGGHAAGTVDVIEAKSDIQIIAASPSADELVSGDSMYVIGSLYQSGTIAGPQEIELTATNTETDAVTMLGTHEATLNPGFYHLGAVNMSFTLAEPGTYELELGGQNAGVVEVLPAESDIQVIAASGSATELVAGDNMNVLGSLYQNGTIAGPQEIELTATNTETGAVSTLGTHEATLTPGFYHLGVVNMSFTLDEPGTYELTLGDRDAGIVEVLPAESDIHVIAVSASANEIIEGDELYVIGSLYQNGTVAGPQKIELTATNTETDAVTMLGTHEATLNPGFYHLGAVNMSFTLSEPGTYELSLGDRSAGTVTVLAAESNINVIAAAPSTAQSVQTQALYVIGSLYQAGTDEGPEEIALTATQRDTGESTVVGTHEATLTPGFYHLGEVNISFALTEPGTYDLTLGDRDAGTVEIVTPTVDATITAVDGYSTATKPATGETLIYANDDTTADVRVTADLDIETVDLVIESRATRFAINAPATHSGGNMWQATVPVDSIPDDGEYDLSVVVTDVLDTPGFNAADEVLVIDREGPSMSVSIEDVDSNDATVVVKSNEPLHALSSVTAEFTAPDGSTTTETITMTRATDRRFTGTLEFDDTGEYSVTAVGVDRAGNEGDDTASVTINTGFTLNDGEIIIDNSGTSIVFDIAEDADEAIKAQELFIALSENSVNGDLTGGDLGVGFITADLDDFLDYHLDQGTIEGATISLAVSDDSLPMGVSPQDAQIHYHDESTGQWDPVDTSYETRGDDMFLVSTVTHFSTYGALVSDTEPPEITDVSPPNGETLAAGAGETTIRFEYEDALSGINTSAIELRLDGIDISDDSATQITSQYAEHTIDLEDGTSHTAAVTVVDNAGNTATSETIFTVDGETSSSSSPPSSSSSSSGSSSATRGDDPVSEPVVDSGDEPPQDDTSSDDSAGPGSSDAADDIEATDDETPGFGLIAALVSLLIAGLLARRRQG